MQNKIKDRQEGINNYTSYDNKVYQSLQKNLKSANNEPQFIYAHFQMPHFPYLCDSTGKRYLLKDIYDESPEKRGIMFHNYLSFANKKIIAIVDSIMYKSKNPPVIVIQSDHGSREESLISSKADVFRNYSAFYFPDSDYSLLNEKINNINTFRILLNKYFGQNLKMLPNSTNYLRF